MKQMKIMNPKNSEPTSLKYFCSFYLIYLAFLFIYEASSLQKKSNNLKESKEKESINNENINNLDKPDPNTKLVEESEEKSKRDRGRNEKKIGLKILLGNFDKFSWFICGFYCISLSLNFLNFNCFVIEWYELLEIKSFFVLEDYFPFMYLCIETLIYELSIPIVALFLTYFMFNSFRYKNFKIVFYVLGFLLLILFLNYGKIQAHENNEEQTEMNSSNIQENNLESDLLKNKNGNKLLRDEDLQPKGQSELSYSDIFCKIFEIFFEIIGFLLEILA